NGDGNVDLAVADLRAGIFLFFGAGDGTFPIHAAFSFPAALAIDQIAVADLDHDGKLDLIASDNGELIVLAGAGGGAFPLEQLLFVGGDPIALAIADLDRDGKPDLITANPSSGILSVLLDTTP